MYRFFPILSATIQSPFKLKRDKNNFTFEPSLQLVITPGISNSEKISNEDSSNNSFTIENLRTLNRYSGTDKMDNSKRINYGFSINNNNIELKLAQTYEFTNNSNFHKEQGNEKHLSDLLGSFTYEKINKLNYNFRYDSHDNYLKEQNVYSSTNTKIGNITLSYLDQKSKTDEVITQDNETLNYTFQSKEILNFSKVKFSGLYDLKQEINTEYNLGYSYIDECFNVDINFYRKSYKEDSLKPQDILTLMFSFKNIGSYKSNNLNNVKNGSQDLNWKDVN